MRVSHLALDDFRSWKHGVVELPAGPTVLVGANGQGKTNLVEALAYLSTFSSHRVGAEGALVRGSATGETEDAERIGRDLAEELLADGAEPKGLAGGTGDQPPPAS